MTSANKSMSCDQQAIQVTPSDLPLCCPQPDKILWNAHPRVYLPVGEAGRVVCPYCSTEYVLLG